MDRLATTSYYGKILPALTRTTTIQRRKGTNKRLVSVVVHGFVRLAFYVGMCARFLGGYGDRAALFLFFRRLTCFPAVWWCLNEPAAQQPFERFAAGEKLLTQWDFLGIV